MQPILMFNFQKQMFKQKILTSPKTLIEILILNFYQKNYQIGISLELTNCNISDNQALQGNGGALFIGSQSQSFIKQSINIISSTLTLNKANVGGCIDNKIINPIIDPLTIIQNNEATLYRDNTNSYPTHLQLIITPEINKQYNIHTNKLMLQNTKSGQSIPKLIFQLRDQTQKPIFPLNSQIIKVYAQFSNKMENQSNYYIRGNNTAYFDLIQKYFIFEEIELIGIPNSNAILEFKSDSIQILNTQSNQYESNYSFEVEDGEIRNSYNTFTECVVCEQDKYSLDNEQCYSCPFGAKCKNGIIHVSKGYWRKEENSSIVLECVNKQSNCIGDTFGNKVCQGGYIGPLCEECDIYGDYWGQSFSKVGSYVCGECKDLKSYLWKVILTIIWTLFSIWLAIRGDLEELAFIAVQGVFKRRTTRFHSRNTQENSQQLPKKTVKWNKQKQQNSQDLEKSSVYIKVFTNYLQIIGSIITFNINLATSNIYLFKNQLNKNKLYLDILELFKKRKLVEIVIWGWSQQSQSKVPSSFFQAPSATYLFSFYYPLC